MASKTIQIWPLPENCNQDQIKNALADTTVSRILIKRPVAYVELQNEDAIDVLEFTNPENKIYGLEGANFQKVNENFKWDSVSSDSSSIQELKEDREHFEKIQDNVVNLIEPKPQSLITISNCDATTLSSLSEADIKSKVFAGFHSIDRVLKKGNQVIVELQDPAQAEKLQAVFPGLKIPALGNQAHINLEAQIVANFVNQWIEQNNRQRHNKPAKIQEEEKHVLHEEIFPKLNKLTSMETDFLTSQQSSGTKAENKFLDIAEHSSEHVHTKNELPSEHAEFIMGQEIEPQREEIMIGMTNQDQEAERRKQEQQHRRMQEQINRLKQQERKRAQEAARHEMERIQREKHERAETERIEREAHERERVQKERHEAERVQKLRQQKEREERDRQRRQQEQRQRKIKEQEEKKKQQQIRAERERVEYEQKQKERFLKQEQEKLRLAAQKERIEKEKEHQQHIKSEREREEQERKRKQIQEMARKAQEHIENSSQFVLQGAQRGKQTLQNMIGGIGAQDLKNLIRSEPRANLTFWAVVMVTLFALLLI